MLPRRERIFLSRWERLLLLFGRRLKRRLLRCGAASQNQRSRSRGQERACQSPLPFSHLWSPFCSPLKWFSLLTLRYTHPGGTPSLSYSRRATAPPGGARGVPLSSSGSKANMIDLRKFFGCPPSSRVRALPLLERYESSASYRKVYRAPPRPRAPGPVRASRRLQTL